MPYLFLPSLGTDQGMSTKMGDQKCTKILHKLRPKYGKLPK